MNSEAQILDTEKVVYWSREISFSLLQSNRKTMRIEILPNMKVVVKAPILIKKEIILEKIKKRAQWIIKQIHYFSTFHPRITERFYISGETFLYLWRQYILKVEVITGDESVKLKWKFLVVMTKTQENTKKLVLDWYIKNAKEKFETYGEWILWNFEKLNVRPSKISIKTMKSRWWSCSRKGSITLNSELIKAPRWCIEYVLIHELSHLIEFWHTKAFYELQTRQMPDWKKWKNKLEKLLA